MASTTTPDEPENAEAPHEGDIHDTTEQDTPLRSPRVTPAQVRAAENAAADQPPASPPQPKQVPPPPGSGDVASRSAVQMARAAAIRDVGRSIARIITWVAILALGILLAIGVVRVWPQIFDLVVTPVERNTAAIERLQGDLLDVENDLRELEARGLETQTEEMAAMQGQIDELASGLSAARDEIARQDEVQQSLLASLDAFRQELATLEENLAALEEDLPGAAAFQEYNRQLLLMRAWQELVVARIRLAENNPGQAAVHLGLAREALQAAHALSSAEGQAELDSLLARLDQVEANLQTNAFVAFADLDAAWAQISALIKPVDPATFRGGAAVTPAPVQVSPTPTPAEITPTPEVTPTPGG
ncbi:MAG: hypothetical protein Kow00124_20570 [Anaerolineae bacterium]